MGAVVGCTRKICMDKNINELNVDIKENIENLNTINTNKIMQTKSFFENGNGNYINNNNNIEVKEDNKKKDNEEDEVEEEEEEENEDNNDEKLNKYKKELSKIILIQKMYKKHHSKYNVDELTQNYKNRNSCIKLGSKLKGTKTKKKAMYERFNTESLSNKTNLKNNIHKYNYSIINPVGNKNKENGKNDEEGIISVERPFMPLKSEKSSKLVNNFKALDALKSTILKNSLVQQNSSQNNIQQYKQSQNYLKILNDFGEKKIFNIQK